MILFMFMLIFIFFSAAEKLNWLEVLKFIRPYFWIVSDGSLPSIVMAGIVVASFYKESLASAGNKRFFALLISGSLVMFLFCFSTLCLCVILQILPSPSSV